VLILFLVASPKPAKGDQLSQQKVTNLPLPCWIPPRAPPYRACVGCRFSDALHKLQNIHLEILNCIKPMFPVASEQKVQPLHYHLQGCRPLTLDLERITRLSKGEA